MTAPTRDPLAVTTRDGMSWVRRAVTQDGRGLYAPEGVCSCPEFVMATLAELAEHGIKGRDPVADAVAVMGALPVPLGHAEPVPQPLEDQLTGARLSLWEEEQDAKRARFAAKLARKRAAKLRARVADLEAAAGDGATRSVDEDPIAYSLTPEALHASSGAVIETTPRPEDVSRQVTQLRGLLSRQRAAVEEPHDDPVGLHHDYRTPHDLPEVQR